MARLIVVFDPNDRISGIPVEEMKRLGVKEASLSIPENLEGNDIYAIAKKLSELLLEQL